MKHLTKIFLLGTAVLAAAACQREPLMRTSGDDSEKQDVVVDLVLNVATGQNASTKMTDANVQMSNNFLGIQNAIIIPFETGNSEADKYVTLNTYGDVPHTKGNQFYDLGLLFPSSMIPGGEGGTNADKSRRVVQLSIPLGTDAMLFYGKAYNPITSTGDPDTDAANLVLNRRTRGALLDDISTTPTDPSDIHFNLVSRLTGEKAYIPANESEIVLTDYTQTAELMEYILNYVIHDSAVGAIDSYRAPKDVTTYHDLEPLSWANLAIKQNNHVQLKPLEDILATAYNKIMTVNANEYRGASSYAVSLIIDDLAEIIDAVVNAVPTGKEEANAIRLAHTEIQARINKFFIQDNNKHYQFQQLSLLKGHVTETLQGATAEERAAAYTSKFGHAKEPSLFPYELFRIPEGAAQMGIDSEGKIEYKIPNRALLHPDPNDVVDFPPYKYTYPAELAYYVNSPLLVTTTKVEDSDTYFPNGYNKWYNQSYWDVLNIGWGKGFVGTETKGVAIRDNVNYGVAMLETNVSYSASSFNDNRGHFSPTEGDATIDASQLSLELYGVLIGGQNVEVNWQYLSTTNDESKYSFVLYDDIMQTTRGEDNSANYVKPGSTVTNYTLVLDNYINKNTQLEVPVALEFINRGVDFWGRDNLIRTNATFYLLGKLKTTGASSTIDWTITEDKVNSEGATPYVERYGYQVPPIYGVGDEAVGEGTRGKSKKITRVFIQNFTTTANFKIGANSLKNAYVTLPDLRSSQMSLGLSVDLSWQPGLEFNVEL